jgi:hypothetical protein
VALDLLHRHRFAIPSQDLGRSVSFAFAQVERLILNNCKVSLAVALYVENAQRDHVLLVDLPFSVFFVLLDRGLVDYSIIVRVQVAGVVLV